MLDLDCRERPNIAHVHVDNNKVPIPHNSHHVPRKATAIGATTPLPEYKDQVQQRSRTPIAQINTTSNTTGAAAAAASGNVAMDNNHELVMHRTVAINGGAALPDYKDQFHSRTRMAHFNTGTAAAAAASQDVVPGNTHHAHVVQ
jgi:hypothetical protein